MGTRPVTLDEYLTYREMVKELEPEAFERVRTKTPPTDATDFALRVSYVILNSGMRWTVTQDIWSRMKPSLVETGAVGETFGHPGKIKAINFVMSNRLELFCDFKRAWATGPEGIIEFCETLPYIGGITKYHLAKNLGVDTAKPDVWLERVAAKSNESVQEMCSPA